MKRDMAVSKADRQRAQNVLTLINRVSDYIVSADGLDVDTSKDYATLYELESAAWQLIEKY